MKEDFVSYDIAFKLKEKGFKERCYAYYFPKGSELFFNHNPFRGGIVEDCLYSHNSLPNECMASDFVDAPQIHEVLKWLRKEKNLSVEPYSCACGWRVTICKTGNVLEGYVSGGTCVKDEVKGHNDEGAFDWYEQAALAGIEYVIDNLI